MAFTKITAAERVGKGVTGLANTPGLSTAEIQTRFDALANLAIDKFNTHVDELETDLAERPTNTSMNTAIDAKVVAVGAADMQMAVYDPQGKKRDAFAYADAAASAANAAAAAASSAAALLKTEVEQILTVSVPVSGWTGTAAPYTQTITVAALTSAMHPIDDVVLTGTKATDVLAQTAYDCISYRSAGNGTLTLICYDTKPVTDISLLLKGVY